MDSGVKLTPEQFEEFKAFLMSCMSYNEETQTLEYHSHELDHVVDSYLDSKDS